MRLRTGDRVDGLRIVALLGEGSTSEVYLVEADDGVSYALKLLSVHGSAHRRRLTVEATAVAGLLHPNLVGVFGLVERDGWTGVIMEYVAGPTLHDWLDGQPAPPDEVAALARGILLGLHALHREGLVHRDLKPGNVLLDVRGEGVVPRIADFGLIKQMNSERSTQTGAAVGTPAYMAPEQIRDASRVDARADLYALGVVLFEALTGMLPFAGSDWFEVWRAQEDGYAVPVDRLPAETPADLAGLVRALLEVRPDQRPPDAAACLRALGATPDAPQDGLPLWSGGGLRAREMLRERLVSVERAAPGDATDLRLPAPRPAPSLRSAPPPLLGPDRRVAWIASAALGVIALCGVAVAWSLGPPAETAVVQPTSPSATPIAASTVPAPAPAPPPVAPAAIAPPEARSELGPRPARARGPEPDAAPARSTERPPAPPEVQEGQPVATSPAVEPPAPTRAWAVRGDAAEVWLVSRDGAVFREGQPTPPGRYQVKVRWRAADPAVAAGEVTVDEERPVTLRCLAAFLRCQS